MPLNINVGTIMLVLLILAVTAFGVPYAMAKNLMPLELGAYSVASTNFEIDTEFADIGDERMHDYLLGRPTESGESRYIVDILESPDAAWVVDVSVPDDIELYGPVSGKTLPVASFIAYPAAANKDKNRYAFPYQNATYGAFEDMLEAGEAPSFAEPEKQYPLIIIAHGGSAHGVYDVEHAHKLASHGYIVAVINYGDDRNTVINTPNLHIGFLRPLITKTVIDSLLGSDSFGPHIDVDNIGITGHSFGGFTALAMAGGLIQGNKKSVTDERIKAGVIAAPWIAGKYKGEEVYAFEKNNAGLQSITAPILCLFGSNDEVTISSYILSAIKKLSGPTYVVELVDQPHVFESGSWLDRDNWELLFFSAYLKQNSDSLAKLSVGLSMKGGNTDIQLIEYQKNQ